jgi:membrane associated rhomboid family serine protease
MRFARLTAFGGWGLLGGIRKENMFNNEPRNIGSMTGMSPAVKFLLILNVSIFLLEYILRIPLTEWFALRANWWEEFLGFSQLFTYMFVHGSGTHLLVNMLGLFFIGPSVERTIGSYRFFILYYISGILGGLGWSLIADPYWVVDGMGHKILEYPGCVGASGAIMGMLGAFGALYPNAKLLLWFVIPVRAWVLVVILAIWELSEIVGHQKIGGIANAAHLVGGIAGFCYAMALKHPHIVAELKSKLPGIGKTKATPRSKAPPERLSKEEVDRILDKIGKEGMGALTPREREMLKRATRG